MTIVILWNFWWRIVSYTFFGSSSNYSLCIIIISSVCYPRSAHVLLLLSFGDWPSRAFTWCLRSCELCNCTAIFNNKSSYILLSKKIDLLIWRIILSPIKWCWSILFILIICNARYRINHDILTNAIRRIIGILIKNWIIVLILKPLLKNRRCKYRNSIGRQRINICILSFNSLVIIYKGWPTKLWLLIYTL